MKFRELGDFGSWKRKKTQLPSGTVFEKIEPQIVWVSNIFNIHDGNCLSPNQVRPWFPPFCILYFVHLLCTQYWNVAIGTEYFSNLRICLFGLNGVLPSSPSQTFYTIKRHPYLGFLTIRWRIGWIGQSSFAELESGVNLVQYHWLEEG